MLFLEKGLSEHRESSYSFKLVGTLFMSRHHKKKTNICIQVTETPRVNIVHWLVINFPFFNLPAPLPQPLTSGLYSQYWLPLEPWQGYRITSVPA